MGRSQSANSKPEMSLLQTSRPSGAMLFIVSIGRQQRPAGKPHNHERSREVSSW